VNKYIEIPPYFHIGDHMEYNTWSRISFRVLKAQSSLPHSQKPNTSPSYW